jgi:ribosomal protein S18 acetylase RimI-like enzyme
LNGSRLCCLDWVSLRDFWLRGSHRRDGWPINGDQRELSIRRARDSDAAHLEDVRRAAFAPVFASFRALLGEEISQVTQIRDDQEQAEYLNSLFEPDSGWELYVAEQGGVVVGFVSVQLNGQTFIGEIGLNAVHPDHAGAGIGSKMYDVVLNRMRQEGMRVATVSTGGDASHAPARRAYQKAGFTVGIPSIWLCQAL